MKLRRSLALRTAVFLPLGVATLLFAQVSTSPSTLIAQGDPWRLLGRTAFDLWARFVLPIHVFLLADRLVAMERSHGMWTANRLLPLPERYFFLATAITVLTLTTLSTSILAAAVGAAAVSLQLWVGPPRSVGAEIAFMAGLSWRVWLASAFLVSVATWLAMRSRRLGLPVTAGLIGTLGNLAVHSQAETAWLILDPWALPLVSVRHPDRILVIGAASVAGSVAFIILGMLKRSEVELD